MLTESGMDLLRALLTYDPKARVSCEEALKADFFREHPRAIDPSMFPTWPAKSELGSSSGQAVRKAASPKPPSGERGLPQGVRVHPYFFCTYDSTTSFRSLFRGWSLQKNERGRRRDPNGRRFRPELPRSDIRMEPQVLSKASPQVTTNCLPVGFT